MTLDEETILSLKVAQLRQHLKQRSLPVSGVKKVLQQRLWEAVCLEQHEESEEVIDEEEEKENLKSTNTSTEEWDRKVNSTPEHLLGEESEAAPLESSYAVFDPQEEEKEEKDEEATTTETSEVVEEEVTPRQFVEEEKEDEVLPSQTVEPLLDQEEPPQPQEIVEELEEKDVESTTPEEAEVTDHHENEDEEFLPSQIDEPQNDTTLPDELGQEDEEHPVELQLSAEEENEAEESFSEEETEKKLPEVTEAQPLDDAKLLDEETAWPEEQTTEAESTGMDQDVGTMDSIINVEYTEETQEEETVVLEQPAEDTPLMDEETTHLADDTTQDFSKVGDKSIADQPVEETEKENEDHLTFGESGAVQLEGLGTAVDGPSHGNDAPAEPTEPNSNGMDTVSSADNVEDDSESTATRDNSHSSGEEDSVADLTLDDEKEDSEDHEAVDVAEPTTETPSYNDNAVTEVDEQQENEIKPEETDKSLSEGMEPALDAEPKLTKMDDDLELLPVVEEYDFESTVVEKENPIDIETGQTETNHDEGGLESDEESEFVPTVVVNKENAEKMKTEAKLVSTVTEKKDVVDIETMQTETKQQNQKDLTPDESSEDASNGVEKENDSPVDTAAADSEMNQAEQTHSDVEPKASYTQEDSKEEVRSSETIPQAMQEPSDDLVPEDSTTKTTPTTSAANNQQREEDAISSLEDNKSQQTTQTDEVALAEESADDSKPVEHNVVPIKTETRSSIINDQHPFDTNVVTASNPEQVPTEESTTVTEIKTDKVAEKTSHRKNNPIISTSGISKLTHSTKTRGKASAIPKFTKSKVANKTQQRIQISKPNNNLKKNINTKVIGNNIRLKSPTGKLSRAPLTLKRITNNQRPVPKKRVLTKHSISKPEYCSASISTSTKRIPSANAENQQHIHWTKRAPAPMDPQVKTHNRQAFYWCRKCQLWNTAHGSKQHFGPGIGIATGKKTKTTASSAVA